MSFLNKLLVGFLCGTVIVIANDTASYPSKFWSFNKQHCRASVRHIEGGGIGYKHGYTTLEGFFAPQPNALRWMPFFDIRGHVFNDGKCAANMGFGLRRVKAQRIYGVNAYYDYRNAKKIHNSQCGFGIETLGKYGDFRVNGYFPVNKKIVPYGCKSFSHFSGNHILLSQKHQFAMTGFDAELGFNLGNARSFNFYAAAGPYYFSEKIEPNVWGGKARLACKYKEYVKIELSNSYDKKFYNRFQCQLTLTLPFGGGSTKSQDVSDSYALERDTYCRMVHPVERKEIIVIGHKNKCTPAINPLTCQPYNVVFVDNTSHSLGTYESPYPTLIDAQNDSKVGDIIYVFPGDGTTAGMDAGIILKRNQKLWGSGISHGLQTADGIFIIPAQSFAAPKITNTNIDTEGNAITLDTVNQIRGITITGAFADGVFGTNLSAIDISDCTITENAVYSVDA